MSMTDKLQELMKSRNITKAQLSKGANVPYTTIDGLFKKGSDNVKLTTLKKLADYFECSIDYLADDDNQSYTPQETTFTNPIDAFKYILDTPLMQAYGGYDVHKMTEQELIDFANEIADYAKYIADRKYKKK